MRKLFTAKPGRSAYAPLSKPQGKSSTSAGKVIGLFLVLCIVALQSSFTSAVAGENRTAYYFTDTSTTPVPGKPVATVNKPASTRSNRTSSKPALASNLSRESISFGSPTDGPETEMSIPKNINRKAAAMPGAKAAEAKGTDMKITDKKATEAKATDVKVAEAKTPDTKVTDKKTTETKPIDKSATEANAAGAKTSEVKANDAKATDTKVPDTKNTTPKSAGTSSPKSIGPNKTKSESAPKKSVSPEDQHVDELISNITRTVSADMSDTRTTATTAIRKVGAVNTNDKSTAIVKTTGTVNTKRTGAIGTKSTVTDTKSSATDTKSTFTAASGTKTTSSSIGILANKLVVYDSLHLKQAGLSKKVFALALKGMSKLVTERHIKDNLVAIVDFSQPSNKKRLYVVDLNNYQLLYNTYVAHGMKSGRVKAESFSNKPSSSKSSLGFYITGAPYQGTNGYSLRLTGVEKGINDHAMDRGIVIHGADYVCEGLLESQGFIGRSFGCPAVAQEISKELIDLLKDGSCLFIYHPSAVYKAKSSMIQ